MTVVITSGEGAGIGPDIIIKAAENQALDAVVLADIEMMQTRAELLQSKVSIHRNLNNPFQPQIGSLQVLHIPCKNKITPGVLDPLNASYVISQLKMATQFCMSQSYEALVTAPVHKALINEAGLPFSGHTEFLANETDTKEVVMMLAGDALRVALVTTHLPLSEVPKAITKENVERKLSILLHALKTQFHIPSPTVFVSGLNPHAGEDGHLGFEEINEIIPAIQSFKGEKIIGPLAADTIFSPENCDVADAFLTMYHDQGLCVLKYACFGQAQNITLGLPFLRTSVDHGTALNLAGSRKPSEKSFLSAYQTASQYKVNSCSLV